MPNESEEGDLHFLREMLRRLQGGDVEYVKIMLIDWINELKAKDVADIHEAHTCIECLSPCDCDRTETTCRMCEPCRDEEDDDA